MKTIFSQAYQNKQSNFALLTALAPLASSTEGLLSTACFGDAACQENRELQSQAQLTNAQANLAATQVVAMNEQNDAAHNKVLLYVGIGFGIVVLLLGSIFLLKKQS